MKTHVCCFVAAALLFATISSRAETLLSDILIPPDDPVTSGMVAAKRKYLFLQHPESQGFHEFMKMAMQMRSADPVSVHGKAWIYHLATQVSDNLKSRSLDPDTALASRNVIIDAMIKYSWLVNPTSQIYERFYETATAGSVPLSQILPLAEQITLQVKDESLAVTRQDTPANGSMLAQRQAEEDAAKARRAAANEETRKNYKKSSDRMAAERAAAAAAPRNTTTVILW